MTVEKKQEIKTQATGHNGIITFEVDINDNKIKDIRVLKHSETPGIFNQVFNKLHDNILEQQSFAVDTISGATVMTKSLLKSAQSVVDAKGISIKPSQTQNVPYKTVNISTDVAVIGGGEAGLVSACRALSLGKKVVLVEKNGYLGGATILNGSNVVATGSKLAKSIFGNAAIKDSPEILLNDVTRESKHTNNLKLTQLMATNIGKAIDFISDFADLKYQKAQTQTPEHSVDRQIELSSASSYEFIKKVSSAFLKKGGQILLDTRVEDVIRDGQGKFVGFVAQSKHQTTNVHADSVILASGGFGANTSMRGKEAQGVDYYGPMTSTGDSYSFMKLLDLQADHLDWYKVYPHGVEVEPGIAKLTTEASKRATDLGAIYVNKLGKRIINESDVYSKFRDAILEQPDKIAFLLMDTRTWNEFKKLLELHDFSEEEIKNYLKNHGDKKPIFVRGSLEDVAKSVGIDFASLKETIEVYEKEVADKKDSEFGRSPQFLHSFEGENYYLVEQRDRFATTLGGYVTDPIDLVLKNTAGQRISNLFAAGEVVGGANGHDSMPSMMNSWSISSGYLAGYFASKKIN